MLEFFEKIYLNKQILYVFAYCFLLPSQQIFFKLPWIFSSSFFGHLMGQCVGQDDESSFFLFYWSELKRIEESWSKILFDKEMHLHNYSKHFMDGCNTYDVRTNVQGSLNKFPVFFRMGTFIGSTHMKL